MDLTTLADVKLQGSIPGTDDDTWLAFAITSVSSILETEANRWLAPRGTMSRLFDGILVRTAAALGSTPAWTGPMWASQGGRVLRIPDGVSSLTYLGVSDSDQPDDGTGTYQQITKGIHLRGAIQDGWPFTRIEIDGTANRMLPTTGYNAVKVTASWGPAAIYPRVKEIASIAVVRAWRARNGGDGAPDIVIATPSGGTAILRRIAPAEIAELVRNYGPDTRPAFASVGVG